MDAGFIVHHIKGIGKQVNKPVTNTTRCTLKIATQEQLLWHRPSWTLPLLWHSSLLVYWDSLSSCVRNVFTCAPFLPDRSRFQNQDCGAEREEDQTPDLVSGRGVSGSFLWKHGAINVSSCLYYQMYKNRMGRASLPPSISNCYTLVMITNL